MRTFLAKMQLLIRTYAWILGIIVFSGCAADRDTVPVGECPEPENKSAEYRIAPGDMLNIVVWRNDELSAVVPVLPDGNISTPLVDNLRAAGKTPAELAEDIETILGEYLRTPEVSIIVTAQGAANQIQVVGEVIRPQSVSYRDGLRLLDVVVSVGGTTEFAAANRTSLVRRVDSRQVKCRVRVGDLLDGDMSQNILIYPGDVLVVPESKF